MNGLTRRMRKSMNEYLSMTYIDNWTTWMNAWLDYMNERMIRPHEWTVVWRSRTAVRTRGIVNYLPTAIKELRVERQRATRRDHSLPVVGKEGHDMMEQEEATGTRAVRCRISYEMRELCTNYFCFVCLHLINFKGLYALIRLQWKFCLFWKC